MFQRWERKFSSQLFTVVITCCCFLICLVSVAQYVSNFFLLVGKWLYCWCPMMYSGSDGFCPFSQLNNRTHLNTKKPLSLSWSYIYIIWKMSGFRLKVPCSMVFNTSRCKSQGIKAEIQIYHLILIYLLNVYSEN